MEAVRRLRDEWGGGEEADGDAEAVISSPPTDEEDEVVDGGDLEEVGSETMHEEDELDRRGAASTSASDEDGRNDYPDPDSKDDGVGHAQEHEDGQEDDQEEEEEEGGARQITIDLSLLSRPALEALATLSFLVERSPYPNPGLLANCDVDEVPARVRLLIETAVRGMPDHQREEISQQLGEVLKEVPRVFPALAGHDDEDGDEGQDDGNDEGQGEDGEREGEQGEQGSEAQDREAGADGAGSGAQAAQAGSKEPSRMPSLPQRPGRPAGGQPAVAPAGGARAQPVGLGMGLRPRPAGLGAGPSAPASGNGANGNASGAGAPARAPAPAPGARAPAPAQAPSSRPVSAAPAATATPLARLSDPKLQRVRDKAQRWRTLWARIVRRMGFAHTSSEAQQVFQRIAFAERIHSNDLTATANAATQAAIQEAEQLDVREGIERPLRGFEVRVLCIGMVGSGKSTTIAHLCGDAPERWPDPFRGATRRPRVRNAVIRGTRFKFIDTPGLIPSSADKGRNMRLLTRIKALADWYKPQVVLYFDRLDYVRRNLGDLELFRTISSILGRSMWYNTPVVLTHAGTSPGEGTQGPLDYEAYTSQRAQLLTTTIRQSSNDARITPPVIVAENFPRDRREFDGEPLTPNGKPWRPSVLNLIAAVGILQSLDDDMKVQKVANKKSSEPQGLAALLGGLGGMGAKIPPVAYLATNLAQAHPPKKPPEDEKDVKFDYEIKQLPAEEAKEETRRRRDLENQKRMEAMQARDSPGSLGPEPPQNPTFEHEAVQHRYRYLQNDVASWRAVPAIDHNGYEKDDNITATQLENAGMVRPLGRYIGGHPFTAMCQISKDKNAFSMQGNSEASVYLSRELVATLGAEMQAMGPDTLWTHTTEMRWTNMRDGGEGRKNKVVGGVLVSRLAEGRVPLSGPMAYGFKIEDRFWLDPSSKFWGSLAMVTSQVKAMGTSKVRETAWAGNLEAKLKRGEDDSTRITVGCNLMRHRRDTNVTGSAQAQFSMTKGTAGFAKATINTKGTGQISFRVNSTDKVEMGWAMLVPVLGALWGKIRGDQAY